MQRKTKGHTDNFELLHETDLYYSMLEREHSDFVEQDYVIVQSIDFFLLVPVHVERERFCVE